MSNIPDFEVVAAIITTDAEGEGSVGTGGGGVDAAQFEIVLDDEAGRSRLNVPHFESLVLRAGDQAAGTLGAQSQSCGRTGMGVQRPHRFLVASVDVEDAARLGAAQKAKGIEVIPNDSFDFSVDFPVLAAFTAAVVHPHCAVTAARQQRLDLERVELEALDLFWVRQRRCYVLPAHVPQKDVVIG